MERDSWEVLTRLIVAGDAAKAEEYLNTLTPADTARALSRLGADDQRRLLTLLDPAGAADVLEDVSDAQAADLIEELPPERAAAIVDELQSDDQADVLAELDEEDAEAILRRMQPVEAEDVRRRLEYRSDTAGGLMVTEFLAYADTLAVRDVLADMQASAERYSDYDVQYAYVTSNSGVLLGVLRLRDLLFARGEQHVRDVMVAPSLRVPVDASLQDLRQFFAEHAFLGVPVTDGEGRLLGVVKSEAVDAAMEQQAGRTMLRLTGIGKEELRTMSLVTRCSRRLSWLSINVVLNIVAASVIAAYQDTLAQAIVLAVFLPIISDMSGCSGNQAVAVSIRELTLGLVRPNEIKHVLGKEIVLGLVNGVVLGLLLGGVALFWKGNAFLGVVVGGALALNTLVAVSLGGLIPLVLRGLRFDPALASGPILTTVTDMCGFWILLSLAGVVLPLLPR